ncbi:MAG: Flp family type IVb pilin [Nitrospiraceae bacterium]|nr:Flp family type IVb pilin [Nitrospiraceae bacterium]
MKKIADVYQKINFKLFSVLTSEKGQTAIEYALVAVLIAIVLVFAFKGTETGISTAASKVNSTLGASAQ